jgi:Uma2 family endonuclease
MWKTKQVNDMAIDSKHWDWDEKPHPGGPMSEEEYLKFSRQARNARYEYINGVAVLMAGGTGPHDIISKNALIALDVNFRSGPCTVFTMGRQVQVGTKSNGKRDYLYPDVTLSCNVGDRRSESTFVEMPRLVVEVLSKSTEHKDRGIKFRKYQACPWIFEIVLISQYAIYVEVWQRTPCLEIPPTVGKPEDWRYSHYGPDEIIKFDDLDIEVAVNDLYQQIDFEAFEDDAEP